MLPSIPSYNYKIPVQYTDTKEYRECFRNAFFIDTERILDEMQRIYPNFDSFDHETKDELLFDEPKVNSAMGDILTMTMFAEPFREFYKKAASFVISEVPDIGLAILLAYDYFQYFHAVLVEWFEWLETSNIEDASILSENCRPENMKHLTNSDKYKNFIKDSIPMKKLSARLGMTK
jgi:hypothetical protein